MITPNGAALSRGQYLGSVASGNIDYVSWDPDSIAARVYVTSAVVRYRSRMVVVVAGRETVKPFDNWHTDFY